tara:strand:+ start:1509 stop:1742 length:234 start_codon:yes stop_codon:yes gene_type:complete
VFNYPRGKMRDRTSQVDLNEEQYSTDKFVSSSSKKRLDLNDLLKRAKDQKKNDKKLNILIFSGAASLVAVFIVLLNI